jgi:hypothetical protein
MDNKKIQQKKCQYCGQYFNPDPRVGEKQKACYREECKQKRKREAQEEWKKKNPECLKNHYQDYVKGWRKRKRENHANPDINKQVEISLEKLVLLIPKDKTGMIRDEISIKRVAPYTFAVYG